MAASWRSSWRTCRIKDQTFEDLLGQRGLTALGEDGWRAAVLEGAELLRAAVAAEYVVLGGGNVRLFDELPARFRRGHNDKAFEGGFRAWDQPRAARGRRPSPLQALAVVRAARASARSLREGSRRAPTGSSCTVGEHLFVDYSKNLITAGFDDRARSSWRARPASRRCAIGCSPASRSTSPSTARCCTSRCATGRTGRCRSTAAT